MGRQLTKRSCYGVRPEEGAVAIRLALHGATGRMGKAIAELLTSDADFELMAAIAAPKDARRGQEVGGVALTTLDAVGEIAFDLMIDFSQADAVQAALACCRARGAAFVSGTTGLDAEAQKALEAAGREIATLWSPNMSVGVHVLIALAEQAARILGPAYDAEIVEMHHRRKVDAPSGTAIRLGEAVAVARGSKPEEVLRYQRSGQVGARSDDEIGVMTMRGGNIVGEHTLIFAGPDDRLELVHRAADRSIFAHGALRAAKWIAGQPSGRYTMRDVLGFDES